MLHYLATSLRRGRHRRQEMCGNSRSRLVLGTMGVYRMCVILATFAVVYLTTSGVAADDNIHAVVSVEQPEDEESARDNYGASVNVRTIKQSKVSFDTDSEPFIPTAEWQKVKPGQSIPSGLHVKMDMQTGENEAKLMDGDDGSRFQQIAEDRPELSRLQQIKKSIEDAINDQASSKAADEGEDVKYWKEDGKQGMVNTKSEFFSREELKHALKNFKSTSDDVKDKVSSVKPNKFRSMDQLKKDLADMDLSIKTDPEVIQELINKYKTKELSVSDRRQILEDIEYYVHQIDNAKDFFNMGGLSLVLQECNHTSATVRSEAAFVLGSALQGNPPVQVQALEAGALHHLVRMLFSEQNSQVQVRAVYAMSALVRNFPLAQQALVESSGLQALTQILQGQAVLKTKVKVITLISDLVLERKQTEEELTERESEVLKEKHEQYNRVNIEENVQAYGFCEAFPALLAKLDDSDPDSLEKVIVAMETLQPMCSTAYQSPVLKTELHRLEKGYKLIAKKKKVPTATLR